MIPHLYQSSFLSLFCLLTVSSPTYSPPENPVKEKAKAYDGDEAEKPARHQPNIYTPMKGNTTSFTSVFSAM